MPNWCECRLDVSGPEDVLARFKDAAKSKAGSEEELVFSLQSLVPTPQALLDTVSGYLGDTPEQAALESQQKENREKYGAPTSYEWRVRKWSTKWDTNATYWFSETPTELQTFFDTAWAPPINAIVSIARQFPELVFHLVYAEGGCDFSGGLKVQGDEEPESWEGSYAKRDDCFRWDEDAEDAAEDSASA